MRISQFSISSFADGLRQIIAKLAKRHHSNGLATRVVGRV
jgi:hypothetical protein